MMKIEDCPESIIGRRSSGRKRGETVDKILIMADQPGPNRIMLALLEALFPDCEINIIPRASGPGEQSLSLSEGHVNLQEQGGHDGNHSRGR
jgi:hypothetical protein